MFDMRSIGRKLSSLRKEKNMTQVELADKLGISYQAVSNWERGDSMPDIAKLVDLSKIFDISIDELLGNGHETKIIKDIIEEAPINTKDLDTETLTFILPIMKPSQIKDAFKDKANLKLKDLILLAPYLDTDEVDAIVTAYYEEDVNLSIHAFAPFMSEEALALIIKKHIDKNDPFEKDHLTALAPFLNRDTMDELAIRLYQEKGVKKMITIAPFVSSEVIKAIVDQEIEKGNYHKVIPLMPFAGKRLDETIVESIKKAFKKHQNEDET